MRLHRARLLAFAPCVLFAVACGSSNTDTNPIATDSGPSGDTGTTTADAPSDADPSADPCTGVTGKTVTLDPATQKETDLQNAVVGASPGDVIKIGAGTIAMTNGLVLSTNCVTIQGAGHGQTNLDFSGQLAGTEGVYGDHVKGFTFQGITIKDTKGNAIKVLGGDHVTFRDAEATWTGADVSQHGAYGIYPVASNYVLIENSFASGANDSGMYIGQSQYVVIRNNEAQKNVAGIEIENTYFADVHDNNAHDNTAGILVFDLPDLPQLGGHGTRVFHNTMKNNNTANFAPTGDIVGIVPSGVGFFVMANHDVEVFDNTIDNNSTASAAIISYLDAQLKIDDPKYYPYPARIYVHDNHYTGGGDKPDATKTMGLLLAANLANFPGGKKVPDFVYDGVTDPAATGGTATNPMQVCVKEGTATFSDLHLDKLPDGSVDLTGILTNDATPFDCTLPSPSPVTWPGLAP